MSVNDLLRSTHRSSKKKNCKCKIGFHQSDENCLTWWGAHTWFLCVFQVSCCSISLVVPTGIGSTVVGFYSVPLEIYLSIKRIRTLHVTRRNVAGPKSCQSFTSQSFGRVKLHTICTTHIIITSQTGNLRIGNVYCCDHRSSGWDNGCCHVCSPVHPLQSYTFSAGANKHFAPATESHFLFTCKILFRHYLRTH